MMIASPAAGIGQHLLMVSRAWARLSRLVEGSARSLASPLHLALCEEGAAKYVKEEQVTTGLNKLSLRRKAAHFNEDLAVTDRRSSKSIFLRFLTKNKRAKNTGQLTSVKSWSTG